jgi:hypothetical protein
MKTFVRIFFKDGGFGRWIDIPMPEGNSFPQFMSQARFEGHIQSALAYIPLDQIKIAVEIKTQEAVPTMDFTKAHLQ